MAADFSEQDYERLRRALKLTFDQQIDLVSRVLERLPSSDPLKARIDAAIQRMESMRKRKVDDSDAYREWFETVAACEAIDPPARAKIRGMTAEQRIHLLCTAKDVLPNGNPLRSRIDAVFARVEEIAKNSQNAHLKSKAEQEAILTEDEAIQAEIEEIAIEASRLIH